VSVRPIGTLAIRFYGRQCQTEAKGRDRDGDGDAYDEWSPLLPVIFLCFAFGPQTQKRVSLLPLSSDSSLTLASFSRLHSSSQPISALLLAALFLFLPALKFLWVLSLYAWTGRR